MRPMGSRDGSVEAAVRQRVLAYLIDLGLVSSGVFVVASRLERSLVRRTLVAGLLGILVGSLYHVLLEGSRGQTVGKKAVGIAVVLDDGSRCTYRAATIRTALRFVDALPVAYLAGLLSIVRTEQRQRLGDLIANTVVVRTRGECERHSPPT